MPEICLGPTSGPKLRLDQANGTRPRQVLYYAVNLSPQIRLVVQNQNQFEENPKYSKRRKHKYPKRRKHKYPKRNRKLYRDDCFIIFQRKNEYWPISVFFMPSDLSRSICTLRSKLKENPLIYLFKIF